MGPYRTAAVIPAEPKLRRRWTAPEWISCACTLLSAVAAIIYAAGESWWFALLYAGLAVSYARDGLRERRLAIVAFDEAQVDSR